MAKVVFIAFVTLLVGCSSSPTTESKSSTANSNTPTELQKLIGVGGSAGEAALKDAGYEFRNGSKSDAGSITRWRSKDGACVAVTTSDGKYASIQSVDASQCLEDGNAVAASAKPGSMRTICGVIVGGKTTRYVCEVEENRQGTTVLRMPDTTLRLTWNLGSNSVEVAQEGVKPQVVKYANAEGETNFRVDDRTFFYIANPSMAEMEVKNFRK